MGVRRAPAAVDLAQGGRHTAVGNTLVIGRPDPSQAWVDGALVVHFCRYQSGETFSDVSIGWRRSGGRPRDTAPMERPPRAPVDPIGDGWKAGDAMDSASAYHFLGRSTERERTAREIVNYQRAQRAVQQ